MLSDLLDFVKTRSEDGATLGEIQSFLEIEDKVEAKNLINNALNRNLISKTGEKRGTRYLPVSGAESSEEDNDKLPPIGNNSLDTYLNDATPLHDAVITHIENILPFKKPNNLNEFIQNGRKIISYYINYDYDKKRNVITETQEVQRMNHFVIKENGCVIEKFNQITGITERISFPSYEELREELRLMLCVKH